jgi:hypothetical protein
MSDRCGIYVGMNIWSPLQVRKCDKIKRVSVIGVTLTIFLTIKYNIAYPIWVQDSLLCLSHLGARIPIADILLKLYMFVEKGKFRLFL